MQISTNKSRIFIFCFRFCFGFCILVNGSSCCFGFGSTGFQNLYNISICIIFYQDNYHYQDMSDEWSKHILEFWFGFYLVFVENRQKKKEFVITQNDDGGGARSFVGVAQPMVSCIDTFKCTICCVELYVTPNRGYTFNGPEISTWWRKDRLDISGHWVIAEEVKICSEFTVKWISCVWGYAMFLLLAMWRLLFPFFSFLPFFHVFLF